jgi:hypothetical protein
VSAVVVEETAIVGFENANANASASSSRAVALLANGMRFAFRKPGDIAKITSLIRSTDEHLES